MPTQSTKPKLSILVIRVGSDFFGIDAQSIMEVVPIMEIHQMPSTLPFLEGFVDVRGTFYAVVDLVARFGGNRDVYRISNRILLIHAGGEEKRNLGFIVDEVLQVEEWGPSRYQTGILADSKDHFTGVIGKTEQGEPIQSIDLERILSAGELALLAIQD